MRDEIKSDQDVIEPKPYLHIYFPFCYFPFKTSITKKSIDEKFFYYRRLNKIYKKKDLNYYLIK